MFGNPGFQRKTVRDQAVSVGHATVTTFLMRSTFERCEILLACPASGIIVERCLFRDCTIVAKKAQHDHQFFTSTFEGCKFVGDFSGCEFGFRVALYGRTRGTIADCDLREATLHYASFSNCDLASLWLPTWPHFTLLNPAETARRLPEDTKCPELAALRVVALGSPPITKGLTVEATQFIRESIYSEEELQELLSHVDGVLM